MFYRYTGRKNPMSDYGHAMFAEDQNSVGNGCYGSNLYLYNGTNGIVVSELEATIKTAWQECQEDEDFGSLCDEYFTSLSADEVYNSFNPDDIVNSADGYDSRELMTWLWEKVIEPNEIQAIITNDGAVVFDSALITEG